MAAGLLSLTATAAEWNNDLHIAAGPFSGPNMAAVFFGNDILKAADAQAAANVMMANQQFFGHYSLEYHHQTIPWLEVGAKLTYEYNGFDLMYHGNNDPIVETVLLTGSNYTQENKLLGHSDARLFTAAVSLHFTYVNTRIVKVYSGLDLGIGFADWQRNKMWDGNIPAAAKADPNVQQIDDILTGINNLKNFYVIPAFDIVPVGVKVGGRCYGLAEINIGTDALIKLGFGVRFL